MEHCSFIHLKKKDNSINFKPIEYSNTKVKHRRAGVIFLDRKEQKILLVQSYGVHWGLPKGCKLADESFKDCAIRELYEETGIVLPVEKLTKYISLYRGTSKYFIVDYDSKYKLNTDIIDTNEITGISWMCVDCIEKKILNNEIKVNCHTRMLLKDIKELFKTF